MYQKSWSYAIFFVRYMVDDGWNGYFWFSAILCPFAPLTALRKYVVCDGCNCYFSFWAIFCPFTALTDQKIKISKFQNIKKKRTLEISWSYAILFKTKKKTQNKQTNKQNKHLQISFYTCVPKTMIRSCTIPEIWFATDRKSDI